MSEERLKELLKQAVNMTQATNPTANTSNGTPTTVRFVNLTNNTPTIQRTDDVYKKRGN